MLSCMVHVRKTFSHQVAQLSPFLESPAAAWKVATDSLGMDFVRSVDFDLRPALVKTFLDEG